MTNSFVYIHRAYQLVLLEKRLNFVCCALHQFSPMLVPETSTVISLVLVPEHLELFQETAFIP